MKPIVQDVCALAAIALFIYAIALLGGLAELLILAGRAV